MIITESILHIIDNSSGQLVFSTNKLDLSNEEVYEFVRKKLDRIFHGDSKHGTIADDNHFYKMLNDESQDFQQKSKMLATHFYSALERAEDAEYGDLLVATCTENNQFFYVIMKVAYQKSFTHIIEYDEEILTNKIIPHKAIYRSSGISKDEAVLFNVTKKAYKVQDKYYTIDNERSAYLSEYFLKLEPENSINEQITQVKKAVKQTAQAYNENIDEIMIETQNAIYENIELAGKINVKTVGDKVFGTNMSAKSSYLEKLDELYITEEIVPLSVTQAEKKFGLQKLRLDNGIELLIPVDLYKDKSVVEFITNEDGTTSVILKNIESIKNRF
jgi:hypothetical protein